MKNINNPFDSYLTARQIAELYGVTVQTVERWSLPKPDLNSPYGKMWMKTTVEKWMVDVENGLIMKTKSAKPIKKSKPK